MMVRKLALAAALAVVGTAASAASFSFSCSSSGTCIGETPYELQAATDATVTFTGLPAAASFNGILDIFWITTVAAPQPTLTLTTGSGQIGVPLTSTPTGKQHGAISFAFVAPAASNAFSLTVANLPSSGGVYEAKMTVTAVPEPSTYALMLAGLGVVGFYARRRQKASADQRLVAA